MGGEVIGAVTSEKIADRTIQARDLAAGIIDHSFQPIASDPIQPSDRVAVEVPVAGVEPHDLVVVSPPATLDDGLVFAGSDVLAPGTVTIYLHNITTAPIAVGNGIWTIRQLRTGG